MAAVFSGNTPGIGGMCTDFDINSTELNSALADAEILTNGVLTLTQIDGGTFTNNIPFFSDFVISGLLTTITNAPINRSLNYPAGTYQINATVYTIALGGNFQLTAGDPVFPRVDILYVNNTSTIIYLSGVAALNPIQPTLPAGALLIAAIGVQINATLAANYSLVNVNYNNNIIVPTVLAPGTILGSHLYWNGISWIENIDWLRLPSSGGFSEDDMVYNTTDATGITVSANFGDSDIYNTRGHKLEVIAATYNGNLSFAVCNGINCTEYLLIQNDITNQYTNTLNIDPTINYSKIDSIGSNEYTEVYQDFNTVLLAHYTGAVVDSILQVLPTSITSTVTDNVSGDIAANTIVATSIDLLVQDTTGAYSLSQIQFDGARIESTDSTLNFTSNIDVEDTLIIQRCRDIIAGLESTILFNPAILSSKSDSNGTDSSEVLTTAFRTQIYTEDTVAVEDSAINVRPYSVEIESHSPGLDSSIIVNSTGVITATATLYTDIKSGILFKQRNTAINTTLTSADYMIVTTVNPLTLTLPLAPNNGQEFIFKAITANGGNPIIINGNGKNINGAATTTITTNYGTVNMIFNAVLNIWLTV